MGVVIVPVKKATLSDEELQLVPDLAVAAWDYWARYLTVRSIAPKRDKGMPECPNGIGYDTHVGLWEAAQEVQDKEWFSIGDLKGPKDQGVLFDRSTRHDWVTKMVEVKVLESNEKAGRARLYRFLP